MHMLWEHKDAQPRRRVPSKRLNTTIKNLRKDLAEARELFTESQETIRNLCRENSNLQEELTDLTSSFEPVE